jgi:flagellar biogenesis protein FliO
MKYTTSLPSRYSLVRFAIAIMLAAATFTLQASAQQPLSPFPPTQQPPNQSQPNTQNAYPPSFSNREPSPEIVRTPPVRLGGQNNNGPVSDFPRGRNDVVTSETDPNTSAIAQPAVWNSANDRSAVVHASTQTATNARKPIAISPPTKSVTGSVEKPQSTWSSLLSMVFALIMVLTLFMAVAWLIRKSQPAAFVKLPNDVVQVMGRTPMAPRQQMYVVRFGSKLLLVSHQPGQTQTLCEITDEEEVQRLAGLCEAHQPNSITNSFREVFKQVASGKPSHSMRTNLVRP